MIFQTSLGVGMKRASFSPTQTAEDQSLGSQQGRLLLTSHANLLLSEKLKAFTSWKNLLGTLNGIIIGSDCNSHYEAIKKNKTKLTQGIITLLNLIMEKMKQ